MANSLSSAGERDETRARTLNPASMPFFPGGSALRTSDDEGSVGSLGRASGAAVTGNLVFTHHGRRDQETTSMSSVSVSPTEYRSVKSSPSPPQDGFRDRNERGSIGNLGNFGQGMVMGGLGRMRSSPAPPQNEPRRSPNFRQYERTNSYDPRALTRENSLMGNLDTLAETEDTPGLLPSGDERPLALSPAFFSDLRAHQARTSGTPPVPSNQNGSRSSSFHTNASFSSSSPVSSLDSGGQFTPSSPPTFEAQLKASPMMHDILDRLVRCEYTTREIQRDISDMHHKVNLLLERSLGANAQPEFQDPFASPNSKINGAPVFTSPSFSGPPRGSIAGIAPNQTMPGDDIGQISQRLNTLTSSVGQLLALQTQQHNRETNTHVPSNANFTNSNASNNMVMNSDSPNNHNNSPNPSVLNHGLPNRPDLRPPHRAPNAPMRTWSAGNLDLPVRPTDPPASRQDNLMNKRRSVSNLLRRDSSGVIDTGDGSRENSPMISKWEQLPLAPDLLRSLAKFGIGPPNKIQQRALPFLLKGSDIIAQAPPTQERIAAYVIPAIQIAITNTVGRPTNHGPIVIMISTTVDQATQAQRMIRDLGGPIGVRSALGVGATSASNDLTQELRLLQQNMPHIICGTPQKLHALFTAQGGLVGTEVRFLVLDEVDQLIARNLHEFVFNIVKLLPPPRSKPAGNGTSTPGASTPNGNSQNQPNFEGLPSSISPFQSQVRKFSTVSSANSADGNNPAVGIDRQTALFSNTVPQDVLNLASAIQLREPVRVLVRRDGNVASAESNQGSSRGLRQFYLYLAFTAGGRSDPLATPGGGLGIIGSGRGASNAESAQAREWKLDALADLFDDVDVNQAIVHVGGLTALDSVVYKLASRGVEAVPLHGDMNASTKLAALNKFRSTSSSVLLRQATTKVLVVYDVQVKTPEVSHVPLIINYDLPKAVEEYAHRVAPAIASNYSRAGVIVNFVTATGGDVEMLRSIECFYKIKCPEVPMSLRDII